MNRTVADPPDLDSSPGNAPLRTAIVVYVILLLPRIERPLYHWSGLEVPVLDWLTFGLDRGQLVLLTAWLTRRAHPVTRVAVAAWSIGVIALAAQVPHIATYALLHGAQAAVVGAILFQVFGSGPGGLLAPRRIGFDLALGTAALPAMLASGVLAGWIWMLWPPPGSSPVPQGPWDQLALVDVNTPEQAMIRFMVTGVVEEGASALLVAGLARRRMPVVGICLISVAIRAVYHAYTGWSSVGVAVMAVSMVLLYLRYGRVVPLIFAHGVFDMSLFLPVAFVLTATLAGVMVLYTMGVIAVVRRRDSRGLSAEAADLLGKIPHRTGREI